MGEGSRVACRSESNCCLFPREKTGYRSPDATDAVSGVGRG